MRDLFFIHHIHHCKIAYYIPIYYISKKEEKEKNFGNIVVYKVLSIMYGNKYDISGYFK